MAPRKPKIGTMLRDALRRKGIKQGQFADDIGAARPTVNKWINDKAYPQDYWIGPIEDELEVRFRDLEDAPAVVQQNADFGMVVATWFNPGMTLSERQDAIVVWLRENHPERLEGLALLAT
jgi:transcriptional regulator with XRE-family HTH domain